MSRYVRCPDCHRMFANNDKLASHVSWQWSHPKAKRMVRRHKAAARKQARRQRWLADNEDTNGPPRIGWGRTESPSMKRKLAAHKRAQGVT